MRKFIRKGGFFVENKVENLLMVYCADDGELKILLKKNNEEPYKNYWILPGEILDTKTTQEESTMNLFKGVTSLNCSNFIQGGVFTELGRKIGERTIAIVSIVITDRSVADLKMKKGFEWFDIDELPKLAFDHRKIILSVSEELKSKIIQNYSDILLKLFPSDFTLTEFQRFYENMLGKKIDRRNFRKKMMSQDLVIDTGEKTSNKTGRPGTLYRFNVENMRGKRL